jgi:type I restriction enzyme, S subunit
MKAWTSKRLEEIADIQSGGTPLKSHREYWNGDIAWYSSGELNETFTLESRSFITKKGLDESNAKLFPKGSLLIGMYDTAALKMSILDRDAAFNQAVAGVKPNEHIDLKFILYAINSIKSEILNQRRGVRQKNLSLAKIKNIKLLIPSLSEQKRIVAIVDEAFESINIAIENTKKNLTNARELFESYLNAIFTHKDNSWENQRLGDIAEVQSGGTPLRSKNEYWGGNMAWYSSGELNDLYTVMPERKITELGLKNSNAKSFPKGSLLIGMYDTAALKMSVLDREAAFNQAIAGVKPNSEIDVTFILHAINAVKPELLNLRRGVRQKNLSLQKIKDIVLAVPELQEQRKVVRQLALINAETQRLEIIYQEKLVALTELKQSILQKAFTGELTADSTNQTTKTAKEVIAA